MKISRDIKIVLILLTSVISFFLGLTSAYALFSEDLPAELLIKLIVWLLFLFSAFGFIYQIKTFKLYEMDLAGLEVRWKLLWIGNFLFAISLIGLSLLAFLAYFSNIYNNKPESNEDLSIVIIFLLVFVFGILLILEESQLYRRIRFKEKDAQIDSIEDIKGIQHKDEPL